MVAGGLIWRLTLIKIIITLLGELYVNYAGRKSRYVIYQQLYRNCYIQVKFFFQVSSIVLQMLANNRAIYIVVTGFVICKFCLLGVTGSQTTKSAESFFSRSRIQLAPLLPAHFVEYGTRDRGDMILTAPGVKNAVISFDLIPGRRQRKISLQKSTCQTEIHRELDMLDLRIRKRFGTFSRISRRTDFTILRQAL